MNQKSMEPYGLALLDYFNGDSSAKVIIHRDDGEKSNLPIEPFFRGAENFLPMEQTALDLCYGRVLDVGAGAGPHSLELQNKGLYVCARSNARLRLSAIDISTQACEIMKKRGVKDVRCVDILYFEAEPFDTVLMLGRGIGIVENLAGLDSFLDDVHKLVKQDGQILLNSLDVRCTNDPVHLTYHEANRKANRYFGECCFQFEYKGQKGPVWKWLFVDPETLSSHALKTGWSCRIISQEESGGYLAQLAPLEMKTP